MKSLLCLVGVLGIPIALATPAEAQNYPWCAQYSNGYGGSMNYDFVSFEHAMRLESAIAALPLPFREALVLRDVQELDYREIAEVTKVPIGTIMSRLARARRRLLESLAEDGA